MSFLLLHIIASSLLVLLVVARFLIITLGRRSLASLRLSVVSLATLTAASGLGLVVTASVSVSHICLSAIATAVLVILAEVWLRSLYIRQYSKDS